MSLKEAGYQRRNEMIEHLDVSNGIVPASHGRDRVVQLDEATLTEMSTQKPIREVSYALEQI